MPLDASVVLSKVDTAPQRLTLNPSRPEVVVDGNVSGATVAVVSGAVLTTTVDNAFTPGAWTAVSGTQAIAAGARRAFKQASADHAVVSLTFA